MADNSNDEFYQYVGCYKNDGRNRLLSDDLGKHNEMSPLLCYEYCTSGEIRGNFNYFGTQKGNHCYCGKLKNIQAPIPDPSKCNTKCKGNHSDEICGGKKEASVYIIKKLPMVPSTAMSATSDFTSTTMTATSNLTSAKMTTKSVFHPTTITATSVLPPATMKATSVVRFATVTATTYSPSAKITTTLKLPSATVTVTSERDNQTKTPKGAQINQANKGLLAGIGIGVVVIACLLFVAVCCFLLWRRKLRKKQIRERSNTYRNADDMDITSNQNVQTQGNSFSYSELTVYNHNHAYDELQIETNDTINGKVEVIDIPEGARLSNDNYTVLVVPEDQNSTLVTNTTGFSENISDNKAFNKTNHIVGAYAILDPKETGFDRTKPEQEIKADSYAVLDPAETGFDRTKDRDEVPIQLVKHEHWDKALQKHANTNTETRDEMKNQNGGTHSIPTTNKIESIENKAEKNASKKSNIGIGEYATLDPDATGFDRTKPDPKLNDDSYTVLDPAETGFDRTKYRDDMPSQSVKIENSGKSIHGHFIQNQETNGEGIHSLNKDGQYDLLNQVCRPKDDSEHTYSHSVDDVYDITNINRIPRTDDSSYAYDHL